MAPGCLVETYNEPNTSDSGDRLAVCSLIDSIKQQQQQQPQLASSSSSSSSSSSLSTSSESNFLDKNTASSSCLFVSYDDEINLDDIPLPLTPPPDVNSCSAATATSNAKKQPQQQRKYDLLDTCDTFEILEQTILKQKRLAKLKNTDLRRKILLKRTFDLVCEIMDHENGFNDDDDDDEEEEEVKINKPTKTTTTPSINSNNDTKQPTQMELDASSLVRPLDHQAATVESDKCQLSNLTLVKLDDDVYIMDKLDRQSAQVLPLCVKRRRSTSDDDEDDQDEDDDEKHFEINELEGTYFFSINFLNNQQLSCFTTTTSGVDGAKSPGDNTTELNLYLTNDHQDQQTVGCSSSDVKVATTTAVILPLVTRSSRSRKNHHKKQKTN